MRKLLILSFALLTLSVGLWANTITYTATEGLGGIKDDAFDLPVQTHVFNPDTGDGIITFAGDVTEIRDSAFIECNLLTSMSLPNTITKIGKNAFDYCENLTSITLSNTLTTIGERAFRATDLASITIPNSVTTIGGYVLTVCTNLTTIKFEGTACQNGINTFAFWDVGEEKPVTLILPADWETDNLPMNSRMRWHGGYFTSERTFDQYQQAALQEIDNALGEDAESSIFHGFITYYQSAINNSDKSKFIDGVKDAVIAMIPIIKSTYTTGKTEGLAEAQAALPTDPEGTAGTVVTITKDDKTLHLVNPDSVEYDKQE